jgi:protocatechuate 3,4-dioxygenase beta subunit
MLDEATSCTLAPETTEGPYYFDVDSIRGDIREDRQGVTMRLAIRIQDAGEGCAPVSNAVVDIWHCDAEGLTRASNPPARADRYAPAPQTRRPTCAAPR